MKSLLKITSEFKTQFVSILFLILFYQILIIYFIPLSSPTRGDERHFVETIVHFKEINISTLKDYKQVIPPAVFVIYSLWGKLVGYELAQLRILSVIIAFITFIFLFIFFRATIERKNFTIPLLILFMLNPYIIGFNVYIFTDLLTIFFSILFCLSILKNWQFGMFSSGIMMLLCRQYSIIFLLAAAIYFLAKYFKGREIKNLNNIFILLFSALPLISLFILWQGIAPAEGLKYWRGDGATNFVPNFLFTYLVFSAIYCSPLILYNWKSFLGKPKYFLIYCLIGLIYFLFPVIPAQVTIVQTDLETVGVLHRFLVMILQNQILIQMLFYIFFIFGLIFFVKIVLSLINQLKQSNYDFEFFLNNSILLFYLIMPFSYQVWEKYLLLIIPLLFIRLMTPFKEEKVIAKLGATS